MKYWDYEKMEYVDKKATPPKVDYKCSMTDKSHYRPNVSSLNNVIGQTGEIDKTCYMFQDGKDNGDRYYNITSKSLDIVEKQEAIKEIKAKAESEKTELSELAKTMIENENTESVENCTTSETVKTE